MTVSAERGYQCTQDGCPFQENGTCLEQIQPVEECPHLKKLETSNGDSKLPIKVKIQPEHGIGFAETQPEAKRIAIYPASPLEVDQVDAVMGEAETIMVIVAGDVDSGKTTLIALTYSAFLKGPVGDWRFAGSRTLLGYENCVQSHRLSERQDTPSTPRTVVDVNEYYHLDLQSVRDRRRKRLLLHNISGERYQQAMDTTIAAEELHFLRRADIIVVMIDGESLLKKASCSRAKSRLVELLLAIAKVGHLEANQPVQILISRWDAVVNAGVVSFVEQQMREIQELATRRLAEVQVASPISINGIASVTRYKETRFGHGYGDVLETWVSLRPKPVPPVVDELALSRRVEGWTALGRRGSAPQAQRTGENDA
jgi:Double-GTPase 2